MRVLDITVVPKVDVVVVVVAVCVCVCVIVCEHQACDLICETSTGWRDGCGHVS